MGCVYALVAAGLSLIFGLMELVNFAHGEFLMLAMYVAFFAWSLAGLDPVVGAPVAAAVLGAVGWLTYHGLIRRVLAAPMLAQIFATFGLAVFLRNGAQFAFGVDFLTVGQYLQPTRKHHPVVRFVPPDEFEALKSVAASKGFLMVSASPLTRSSHHAGDDFARLRAAREAQAQAR